MAKLRRERDPQDLLANNSQKHLRVVGSGTLFLTHTLSLPSHPSPSSAIRAHSVTKTRGGSASTLLSLLAQFPSVEAVLIAPLGGNDEGKMIIRDLHDEGVITQFCKTWKGCGVPSAWVLHSTDNDTRTVINHNPLPDITHEEFVSMLGPLLAPENYIYAPSNDSPTVQGGSSSSTPRSSTSNSTGQPQPPILYNPNSPAPFDWLHFEGRSVKTTLNNLTGLDGLARERKWRSHCVFSVDVGRKGRQGVEALFPHVDVLFLNKYYAQTHSPHYKSPRAFLLSFAALVPPHALLVAHWGSEGAALLSLPTKEYFQSSGWVEERSPATGSVGGRRADHYGQDEAGMEEVVSVRSGSDYWASEWDRTPSSSAFTGGGSQADTSGVSSASGTGRSKHAHEDDNDDNDSQGTEVPGGEGEDEEVMDEVGAQDAFVAGMIYSLSRKVLPGAPYTPSWNGGNTGPDAPGRVELDRGRWKLDECLRFATELAGRKARRRSWKGLADEMARAGWFDNN